jgi:hypothetical protein
MNHVLSPSLVHQSEITCKVNKVPIHINCPVVTLVWKCCSFNKRVEHLLGAGFLGKDYEYGVLS